MGGGAPGGGIGGVEGGGVGVGTPGGVRGGVFGGDMGGPRGTLPLRTVTCAVPASWMRLAFGDNESRLAWAGSTMMAQGNSKPATHGWREGSPADIQEALKDISGMEGWGEGTSSGGLEGQVEGVGFGTSGDGNGTGDTSGTGVLAGGSGISNGRTSGNSGGEEGLGMGVGVTPGVVSAGLGDSEGATSGLNSGGVDGRGDDGSAAGRLGSGTDGPGVTEGFTSGAGSNWGRMTLDTRRYALLGGDWKTDTPSSEHQEPSAASALQEVTERRLSSGSGWQQLRDSRRSRAWTASTSSWRRPGRRSDSAAACTTTAAGRPALELNCTAAFLPTTETPRALLPPWRTCSALAQHLVAWP